MAYTRRGFKGGAAGTTLTADVTSGSTSLVCGDLSTWAGVATTGPFGFTINRGHTDEEQCQATGISGNNLTGVTRGVGGTTAQGHTAGASVEHTTLTMDFDEANAHIADVTLNHHTQYARLVASNQFTADTNFFGRGASGATGSYIGIGHYDNTDAMISAAGSGPDVALVMQSKGAGSVYLRNGGATDRFLMVDQNGRVYTTTGASGVSSDGLLVENSPVAGYAMIRARSNWGGGPSPGPMLELDNASGMVFQLAAQGKFVWGPGRDSLVTGATTVGGPGIAAALPGTPASYLVVSIGGSDFKIPYYNP